jgi:hypothetical protein
MYDMQKERIFIRFPTDTHEAMVKIFQFAFDQSMRDQNGNDPLPWESGTAKTINFIKDEEVVAKFVPDFTIYRPSNDAIVVVEVAYSQEREEVRNKAKEWLKKPSMIAVIILHIDEEPKFHTKVTPPSRPPLMSHWNQVQHVGDLGPLRLHEHIWAGTHTLSMEIFERDQDPLEVVRTIKFLSTVQTTSLSNNRSSLKLVMASRDSNSLSPKSGERLSVALVGISSPSIFQLTGRRCVRNSRSRWIRQENKGSRPG